MLNAVCGAKYAGEAANNRRRRAYLLRERAERIRPRRYDAPVVATARRQRAALRRHCKEGGESPCE